ncbi:MAG TPA: DUF58 domain-containing protein [Anaerolineales bacterium]|nr:DUF58 domain-containing protein [Anaerolineales bacterium]
MTVSSRIIAILLGLSVLALAITGSPIYSRLSYLWLFLLLGNWVWAAFSLRGVEIERDTRTLRSQVGQVFEERFEVRVGGRLPRLWLEVRDESTLPGTHGSRVLTLLRGNQSRSYRAVTRLTRRGVFPLGPTVLTSGDPFGLFPRSRTVPPESSLLVYPLIADVSNFPSPAGLLSGGEALRRRTHQITPNAAGVRDYAPGDSLNRIHWVSTARRGRLMAKEFELDPFAPVWIFLDGARAAQAALPHVEIDEAPVNYLSRREKYSLPPSTEEYGISAAASLARYFVQRKRAVGLACKGDTLQILQAEAGGRQLGKILEALALLRAEGDLSILALVMAQARHLLRGSTVVLVTPSVEDSVMLAMDHLQRRSLRPVAVLLDSESFGGPAGTAALATSIRLMGVPVRRVAHDVPMSIALSGTDF